MLNMPITLMLLLICIYLNLCIYPINLMSYSLLTNSGGFSLIVVGISTARRNKLTIANRGLVVFYFT